MKRNTSESMSGAASSIKRAHHNASILNPSIIKSCTYSPITIIIITIIIIIPSACSFPVTSKVPPLLRTTDALSPLRPSQQRLQHLQYRSTMKERPLVPALYHSHIQLQDTPGNFYSTTTTRLPIRPSTPSSSPSQTPSQTTKPSPPSPTETSPTETSPTLTSPTETSRWLSWMTVGRQNHAGATPPPSPFQKRGSAEIRMRAPIEMGGLPRSERYAASDWLHNTANLPKSAILREIRGPVACMTAWAGVITVFRGWLVRTSRLGMAESMCFPAGPHGMMLSTLGLLLVFRTNSAYQRFAEGRKIWEEIHSTSRDLSRLANLYKSHMGSARLRRVQNLLAAFPYFLRYRIRPQSIMKRLNDPEFVRDKKNSLLLYPDHATSDADVEAAKVASVEETTGASRRRTRELYWVDKRTLPWRLFTTRAQSECASAQNRPLWVCDRMAKELFSISVSLDFTARERLALITKVDKLSQAIGACERIHQTVVPLNYARHALRSLTVWLLSLPFALVKDMGLMTGPILFVMSWMLFGVYEIGYSIEDPFQGTLRLSILCDAIRRDVLGDDPLHDTAFVLEDEHVLSKEGVDVNQDYLADEIDYYDDDDNYDESDDSGLTEDIMIDSMGVPRIMNDVRIDEAVAIGRDV